MKNKCSYLCGIHLEPCFMEHKHNVPDCACDTRCLMLNAVERHRFENSPEQVEKFVRKLAQKLFNPKTEDKTTI